MCLDRSSLGGWIRLQIRSVRFTYPDPADPDPQHWSVMVCIFANIKTTFCWIFNKECRYPVRWIVLWMSKAFSYCQVQELWTGLNRTDQARVFPTIGSKLTPFQIQVFVQVSQVTSYSYVLTLASKIRGFVFRIGFPLKIKKNLWHKFVSVPKCFGKCWIRI